jgi:hypothetical protein
MKLGTNLDRLVRVAAAAKVAQPVTRGYQVSAGGEPRILPLLGGIVYNVKCGDPAMGWAADHLEPGVALELPRAEEAAVRALNTFAQIGNPARVLTGAAKGARGVVTGKHGGIEHVHVDFAQRDLERMAIGDQVQIATFGLGLELADFPAVRVMNLDPRVLGKMRLSAAGGKLVVPVALVIPAELMGSGLGQNQCQSGDYDIQTADPASVRRWGLERLRLGDFVAILDADHSFGRIFRKGAVSVGVVVHGDCIQSGPGPGLVTAFTSATGKIAPKVVARGANLAELLGIGAARRGGGRRTADARR